jgi:hypothetical protein
MTFFFEWLVDLPLGIPVAACWTGLTGNGLSWACCCRCKPPRSTVLDVDPWVPLADIALGGWVSHDRKTRMASLRPAITFAIAVLFRNCLIQMSRDGDPSQFGVRVERGNAVVKCRRAPPLPWLRRAAQTSAWQASVHADVLVYYSNSRIGSVLMPTTIDRILGAGYQPRRASRSVFAVVLRLPACESRMQ